VSQIKPFQLSRPSINPELQAVLREKRLISLASVGPVGPRAATAALLYLPRQDIAEASKLQSDNLRYPPRPANFDILQDYNQEEEEEYEADYENQYEDEPEERYQNDYKNKYEDEYDEYENERIVDRPDDNDRRGVSVSRSVSKVSVKVGGISVEKGAGVDDNTYQQEQVDQLNEEIVEEEEEHKEEEDEEVVKEVEDPLVHSFLVPGRLDNRRRLAVVRRHHSARRLEAPFTGYNLVYQQPSQQLDPLDPHHHNLPFNHHQLQHQLHSHHHRKPAPWQQRVGRPVGLLQTILSKLKSFTTPSRISISSSFLSPSQSHRSTSPEPTQAPQTEETITRGGPQPRITESSNDTLDVDETKNNISVDDASDGTINTEDADDELTPNSQTERSVILQIDDLGVSVSETDPESQTGQQSNPIVPEEELEEEKEDFSNFTDLSSDHAHSDKSEILGNVEQGDDKKDSNNSTAVEAGENVDDRDSDDQFDVEVVSTGDIHHLDTNRGADTKSERLILASASSTNDVQLESEEPWLRNGALGRARSLPLPIELLPIKSHLQSSAAENSEKPQPVAGGRSLSRGRSLPLPLFSLPLTQDNKPGVNDNAITNDASSLVTIKEVKSEEWQEGWHHKDSSKQNLPEWTEIGGVNSLDRLEEEAELVQQADFLSDFTPQDQNLSDGKVDEEEEEEAIRIEVERMGPANISAIIGVVVGIIIFVIISIVLVLMGLQQTGMKKTGPAEDVISQSSYMTYSTTVSDNSVNYGPNWDKDMIEDLCSLDNDSFLNSLEAVTTTDYWAGGADQKFS